MDIWNYITANSMLVQNISNLGCPPVIDVTKFSISIHCSYFSIFQNKIPCGYMIYTVQDIPVYSRRQTSNQETKTTKKAFQAIWLFPVNWIDPLAWCDSFSRVDLPESHDPTTIVALILIFEHISAHHVRVNPWNMQSVTLADLPGWCCSQ